MKKQIWSVGAAAAMVALCGAGAMAQDNTTGATPITQPVAFTPLNLPTITAPPAMDYKVLTGQPFTYMDLEQAHQAGLSDREVATIAKVAWLTGMSFYDIRESVLRGESFPMLAEDYGLNIADVYDVDDEMQTIQNFKDATRTTGYWAMRNTQMNGSPYPTGDMSGGGMSSGTGMSSAPSPAPAAPMVQPTSDTSATSGAMTPSGTVVDVINMTPRLSTLAKAIQAAGLADTLNGAGPFTIFAPDNAAFRRLPKGALNNLMANPTALANVLQYHVISGQKIDAATAMSMTSPTSPPTVQGGTLQVTTSNGKVMINNATVVQAGLEASNGIVHVIDHVLMPPAGTGTGQ